MPTSAYSGSRSPCAPPRPHSWKWLWWMSSAPFNLQRFVRAQARDHAQALAELRAGRKQTHWIWYVLPQIRGLGASEMARHYGIMGLDEARAYLAHPLLGPRLGCSDRLLQTACRRACGRGGRCSRRVRWGVAMAKAGQRKCMSCGEFFLPDHRSGDRQRYCCAAPCRRASKAASQAACLPGDLAAHARGADGGVVSFRRGGVVGGPRPHGTFR